MLGRELADGLAAGGLFAAPGLALTCCFPSLRRRPPARRTAYGYLLGLATVAGALFGLSHGCGVPLRRPAVLAVAATLTLIGLMADAARRLRVRAAAAAQPPAVPEIQQAAVAGIWAAGGPLGDAGVATPPHGSRYATQAAGAASSAAAARRCRRAGWRRRRGDPVAAACLVATALIVAGVVAEAELNPVHDFDGRMTWDTQARYLRAEGSVDAAVLTSERWYVTHPQYPLLLPVAQVAVLETLGADPDSHAVRFLYAACFVALLLVIYDGARRAAGRRAAAVIALAAAAIPFFILGEGGAATTFSDLPLACFYGAASVLLLAPRRPAASDALAAGLLLGGAALTKDEGLPLALLLLVLAWTAAGWSFRPARRRGGRQPARPAGAAGTSAMAPAGPAQAAPPSLPAADAGRPRRDRFGAALRAALAAAPVVAAAALLISWRAGVPNRQDESYWVLASKAGVWSATAAHAAAAAPVVARQMTSFKSWAGFWWMAAALLIAGRQALCRTRNWRRLAAAAGPLGIGWAAYLVYPEPALLAEVTWDRFLLQGCVPFLIVLAGALRTVELRLLRRWRRRGPAPDVVA
jgi:hypothetical protein